MIINADDLAWSRSVDRGIIEAHRAGMVTSASLLATGASFDHAVSLAQATPSLSVGMHLSFYRGTTILAPERVSGITGPDGLLLGSWTSIVSRLVAGTFDLGQLEGELRAQVDRAREAGIQPTHLDGEKHLHLWPSVFDIVCRLAVEYDIREVRVVRERPSVRPIPAGLTWLSARAARVAKGCGLVVSDATIGLTEAATDLAALARLLRRARAPHVEFIVHPGRVDEEFMRIQSVLPNRLVHDREEELAVLTSAEARCLIESAGYELVGRGGWERQ